MKIIATIEARMNSKRLPNKVMSKISGEARVIEVIVNRVKKSLYIDEVLVATTKNSTDDKLVNFLRKKNIKYYRGPENNVLKRIVRACDNKNPDLLVQLTGDNPAVDPEIIDYMIAYFKKNYSKYDYVTNSAFSNLRKRTIPLGLDVSIIKYSILKRIEKFIKKKDLQEHPTLYFYREGKKKYNSINLKMKKKWVTKDPIRLTLDTKQDLKFLRELFDKIIKKKGIFFSTPDIYNIINKNKKLLLINKNIKQKIPLNIFTS